MPLFCGLACSSTLVPVGASRVALKSKLPINAAYAERYRFLLDDLKRFTFSCACGIRRSHSLAGNRVSQRNNPVMRWFLKVLMALSAAFHRCTCGGTSWYLTLASSKANFKGTFVI